MAHSARTLRPTDELSRYRIVGPLGAGGMGEVYLAQDTALGRNVALKILPPELVRSEARVQRFVLEARSASSLSHPNIVTIHEIGQDVVKSAGEPPSGPVHFISMELVSGKSLSALIHEEKSDLRALLGWLAQAADGIAKAHAAGIVHRDLKPGNIMVTADGFAKVLDFGLAKLTESRASDLEASSDPTVGNNATGEGTVVGTAGYMSPEQVQGRNVDYRSDIFSFGCILYEAATRRRAFAAESSIETMHKVLHETPPPVEELNPKAPADLRRLIRRCLQKNPEQRLQSMKDLALELRDIEAEYDSLSASASSGSQAAVPAAAPRRASPLPWIVAGVVLVAAAALAWWVLGRGAHEPSAFQKMRMTMQTSSGDVFDAALSADGRFAAYLSSSAGRQSLRVRQVATGSDVVIVPPGEEPLASPSFSPDGNYLYFTRPMPGRQTYRALYQVPSLGGEPREVAFDVDSRVSFSPDGKQFVFRRHSIDPTLDRLVVFDVAARQERVLAEVADPSSIAGAPAWSPDGRQVAAIVLNPGANLSATIALFDARTGRRQDWATLDATILTSFAWLSGGTGLAVAGRDMNNVLVDQVHLRPYPGGRPSRVTNDFSSYFGLSASLADETIAAVRASRTSNLFLVEASGAGARRLTSANSPENSFFSALGVDTGAVIALGPRDGVLQVWKIPLAGGAPRALTAAEAHAINPRAAAGLIVFDRAESGGIHVWAMDSEGGSQRQLTRGAGEQVVGLSPDGRHAVTNRFDAARKFPVVSTADGRVELELSDVVGLLAFSPDSRSIAVTRPERDQQGLTAFRVDVVPLDGTAAATSVRLPTDAFGHQWAPDGRSLSYQDRNDRGWNVFRQPLDGGAPVGVTSVTDGRVLQHRWSPDGRRLAFLVRSGEQVNLWVSDADGARPAQATRISPETVSTFEWLPDSRRLVVEAATRSSDLVLIRDFR